MTSHPKSVARPVNTVSVTGGGGVTLRGRLAVRTVRLGPGPTRRALRDHEHEPDYAVTSSSTSSSASSTSSSTSSLSGSSSLRI
eukprot:900114-Rhodomonas_salina.3